MKGGKPIKIVVSALVVVGALAYLVSSSIEDTMVYYKTVDELLAESSRFNGRKVRVNGVLVDGSIRQKAGTDEFKFQISKRGQKLDVTYAGILPDAMQPGRELVISGVLNAPQNHFDAGEILTKCPSKYEAKARQIQP